MKTGKSFLKSIEQTDAHIWFRGRRIKNALVEPELKSLAETMAKLYDHLQEPAVQEKTCFFENGKKFNASFLIPKNSEDLKKRRALIESWASLSHGLLGRSPDFVNVNFAAWRAASSFFSAFGDWAPGNIEKYFQYISENDLAITHSVVNLGNRYEGRHRGLRLVKETDGGIVVEGARLMATSATVCNEIAIYPGRISSLKEDQTDFAVAFCIPIQTEGLKLICRENYNPSTDIQNHPLSSQYEEMDALVIFDNVFVPWDRVFMFGNPEQYNLLHVKTNSSTHTAHQGVVKSIVKIEFILGACLVAMDAYGRTKEPRVRQAIAEIIIELETMRALLDQAESRASLDQWGVFMPAAIPLEVARVRFMNTYPKLIELVKTIGSSNLMLTPNHDIFSSSISEEVERYLSGNRKAAEQVSINKLLWDLSTSSFGFRQEMYERFYAGGLGPSLEFLFEQYSIKDKNRLENKINQLIKETNNKR